MKIFQIIQLIGKLKHGLNGIKMIHIVSKAVLRGTIFDISGMITNQYTRKVNNRIISNKVDFIRATYNYELKGIQILNLIVCLI